MGSYISLGWPELLYRGRRHPYGRTSGAIFGLLAIVYLWRKYRDEMWRTWGLLRRRLLFWEHKLFVD